MEFSETGEEDKNKFLTVVKTLVDENRGWYKGIVTEFCEMRSEQDADQIDLTKVFYNLHYDVDEPDHENSAPLLQDIKNGDLIILDL